MNLSGKTAIVTGGGRDIGRATCIQLARCGANVVVAYPPFEDPAGATGTVAEIEKLGQKAIAVPADVMKSADIQALVDRALEAFGADIHILVNVAGGLVARKKMDEMDEDFWDLVMGLNLKSTFMVTRAVLPHMPNGGSIVNFASLAARDGGGPGSIAYATAKGGVMTFTRAPRS